MLEGDTLQSIAQRVYGNPSLWYVLAAANAVSDADLVAGTTLKAPQVKTTANDASTFKPYDPNSITGPTTPSLPYISAPPRQHCDALLTVIMVVVAIVVTVYTAGAAAGAMGSAATATGAGATAGVTAGTTAAAAASGGVAATMSTGAAVLAGGYGTAAAVVGGAAGAFAGSAVSQAVGSAMGQTRFSWRNAFASGIAGGLTAGFATAAGSGALGETLAQSRYARAAAGAVVGNLSSVAGNRLVGSDMAFSWTSVAASAISAVITAGVAPRIGAALHLDQATENGQTAMDMVGGLTGGLVSAGVRDSFGEDVNYGEVAADAFGNLLGNRFSGQDALQADMFVSQSANRQVSNGFTSQHPYALASLDGGGVGEPYPEDLRTRITGSGTGGTTTLETVHVYGPSYDTSQWSYWQWNGQADKWLNMDDGRLYAPSRDPKTVVKGWSNPSQVAGTVNPAIGAFIGDLTEANRAYADAHPTPIESLTRSLQPPSAAQVAYYQQHGRPMPTMQAYDASGDGTLQMVQLNAKLDALESNPIVGSIYGVASVAGANDNTAMRAAVIGGAAFDIATAGVGMRQVGSAIRRSNSSAYAVEDLMAVAPGKGGNASFDGHKIYDPRWTPLGSNPVEQYRFSDPSFRSTGGDIYFGENLATAYFEVKGNGSGSVIGKALFAGGLTLERMLDLTDPVILKQMNIDQSKLLMPMNGPADRFVYDYTNQVANEAFVAGYNGIIYQSTRSSGKAVVLFNGRYDPKMIVPIVDMPLP